LRLERCVISGDAGRKLEKIARRGFRGLKAPKRACILHFNAAIFPRSIEIKSDAAEEMLPEMRKKLDYERFLGYTSTGFESGG
jgi:hypothetical protein